MVIEDNFLKMLYEKQLIKKEKKCLFLFTQNYYTINIRLFNDMTSLGYVYVIENKRKKEKRQLETATTAPKK